MKLRRLAAVVSAAVLAFGMVTAVSAHRSVITTTTPGNCNTEQQDYQCPTADASQEPEVSQEPSECHDVTGKPIECASEEPSSEPSEEASTEPSEEASTEPSQETTPSEQPSDGEVEALTSAPTLPPTDTMSGSSTSGPDGTLPLALIVLGIIGLSAVVLTPVRTRR